MREAASRRGLTGCKVGHLIIETITVVTVVTQIIIPHKDVIRRRRKKRGPDTVPCRRH